MINIILLFMVFIILIGPVYSNNNGFQDKEYECLTETRVSGLFQFKRKFLKETEFFPDKTNFKFSKNYTFLVEKESTDGQKFEAKYQFNCKKEKTPFLISCMPIENNNTYNILLSLDTLRYRKTLITNYWLFGKGNEVDHVHIANGYCYDID